MAAIMVSVGLAAAGCDPIHTTAQHIAPKVPPITLAVTPATGTHGVPVSAEVGLTVANAAISSVTLTKGGGGTALAGSFRDDGSSWVPAAPLDYGASYTAVVTAKSSDGHRTLSRTTSFSTMAQPSRTVDTSLYMQSGETYGVGMPVVIEFDPAVPDSARAQIQRRLFVTTSPAQPGVWSWPPGGREVWYRPPQYWQPGTTVSVRAALAGVPMGNGLYGDRDSTATAKIGDKISMVIDNATKQMTVYQDDKPVKQIPVSLGKASTPSSSGMEVTMSHDYTTVFNVPGQYVVQVSYALRLTWGGEYIHAAPWSVWDQGRDNVSHGCVNISDENAKWLYDRTHIGDPVEVKNTEVKLTDGNGWTVWNEPWSLFVSRSALPVPAELANWTPGGTAAGAKAGAHPAPSGSAHPAPTPRTTA